MEKGTAWSRLSPTAKENHRKRDEMNYSVVGAKLPRERADAFRAYCASQGRSVSAVLSDYIYSVIGREAQPEKTGSTEKQTGADAGNQAGNLEDRAGSGEM